MNEVTHGVTHEVTDGRDADPVLHRAATTLRDEPQPEWGGLARRVRSGVRAATPPGRRLLATTHDLGPSAFAPGETLRVGERVVTDVVRRALLDVTWVRTRDVALDVDAQGRCTRARVELAVTYGTEVSRIEAGARTAATVAILATLGPVAEGAFPVDLVVVDVLEPEAHHAVEPRFESSE